MRLINDVLGGNRMLVMVASKDPDVEEPGPDDLYDVGVVGVVARMLKVPDGSLRIIVQGTQRVALTGFVADRALPDRPDRGGPRHPRALAGARGAHPQRPDHLLPDHRADALPARGACGGAGQHRRSLGARAPDRRGPADQGRGEGGAARGARRRKAAAAPVAAAQPRARGDLARIEDPVAGPVRDGQDPARVLPAPADEGDPGRAGRGRRDAGRGQRAARAGGGRGPAGARARGGRPRARALRAPAARSRPSTA